MNLFDLEDVSSSANHSIYDGVSVGWRHAGVVTIFQCRHHNRHGDQMQSGVIFSAAITVIDVTTKEQRTTLTNNRGLFVFQDVPPGNYDVYRDEDRLVKEQIEPITMG